jgi:hypothetical protein
MPKILAIIAVLALTWFSLPTPVKAAPLAVGADVGEDIVAPGGGRAYRSQYRSGRGDYFRGQPWGPGIHYSCAAFGGAAGYYWRWNPYYCGRGYVAVGGYRYTWWW